MKICATVSTLSNSRTRGARYLKKWVRDNKALYLITCLVFDGQVTQKSIKELTDPEAKTLEEYCCASHLRASDNIVKVPPKPHEIINKVVKQKTRLGLGLPRKPPQRATSPRVVSIKEYNG